MSDVFRDPMWQFVAAVLALMGIIAAVFLSLREHHHKSLSCEVLSATPLLSIKEEIRGKLRVLYEGKEVQQVHLVVARITNSGNVPIVQTDYVHPIVLSFGEGKILTAEVFEKNPQSLDVTLAINEKKIVIEPTLLNEADSITIRVLVAQFNDVLEVTGRIVGVKEIAEQFEPIPSSRLLDRGLVIQYSGIVGLIMSVVFSSFVFHKNEWIFQFFLAMAACGSAMTMYAMIKQRQSRRKRAL